LAACMSDGVQDDKLLAAVTGDTAYIVVRGRATFKISPGVKRLFTNLTDKGVRQFILDMSDCPGMDSTFMGVVAGQAIRLKAHNGSVVMIHLSPYLRGLIATLGLDTLVEAHCVENIHEQLDVKELIAQCKPISTEILSAARDVSARTMLDAHETLAQLLPENEEKFRDVLKYLREELSPPNDPTSSSSSDGGDATVIS